MANERNNNRAKEFAVCKPDNYGEAASLSSTCFM